MNYMVLKIVQGVEKTKIIPEGSCPEIMVLEVELIEVPPADGLCERDHPDMQV